MANQNNIHGLSRHIPSQIKRDVRQRDGFGCVLCAVPIIEYEHVDPEFKDAKEHSAAGITLLCPTCHAKVTRKQISKEIVKDAMKDPATNKVGQIGDTLQFTKSHPTVVLGGATFIECEIPLMVRGQEIISIRQDGDRYFLNANLWDSKEQQSLKIVDNEWLVSKENIWDLTIVGNRVSIHEKDKTPTLVFKIENNNKFIIEKFDMRIAGNRLYGDENFLNINTVQLFCCSAKRCRVGINIG
ncbi:TPA: HNH endonuclease [Acinetobacter baumannii]|uniref:HNH endonuclease n=1 Tax=Acinetobacter baumannii TaxID=470 RepID=UPI0002CEF15D|nr:hypothetical protein [Acinetobacter baumannii]ENW46457.1 hypothetical protein F919_01004 [Acinetobacter baumannii NIPH 329]MDC4341200.1 HNH endonuclease [Acinetobacter baumannii]MDN8301878.1 HNH endonuclease [Acinetobacter baumannii]MDN8312271.1 HNH endonuclease [Acinetobacter baumannii]MDN8326523.1 HNH endonuclease [Acinetobacter baumannii]